MGDPTAIGSFLERLQHFRDARLRQCKGQIAKNYLLARRIVREVYRDYAPEELPIDVNRVSKDIDIERDLAIDEECDAINDEFRVAMGILKIVAEKHPEYYERVAKDVGMDDRGWRQSKRFRKVRVRDSSLDILGLSGDAMMKAVKVIIESDGGVTFRKLMDVTVGKEAEGPQKNSMRRYLETLRKQGHIVCTAGKTSSKRYVATSSLKALSDRYKDPSHGD